MVVTKGIYDGSFWSSYICKICYFFEQLPGFKYDDYVSNDEGWEPPFFIESRYYQEFREKFLEELQYKKEYRLERPKKELV